MSKDRIVLPTVDIQVRQGEPTKVLGADAARVIIERTRALEDRLALLERTGGRPGIVTSDTSATVGEFLNVAGRSDELITIILPEPTQARRNARITLAFRNEHPVRIVAVQGTVNRVPFVLVNLPGTFDAICDGLGGWSVQVGVTEDGVIGTPDVPAPADGAQYVLGAADALLPNGSVATDTAEIDVTVTPGGTATWALVDGGVSLTRLADQPDDTFLANISGASGPPTAVALTTLAGAGLTGGADAILAVGAGDGIDVAADSVAVDVTDIVDNVTITEVATNNIQRAALTGFAAAAAGSNATTSAEPIVTYSASANMSDERVLSAGSFTTIDVSVANQIRVNVDLSSVTYTAGDGIDLTGNTFSADVSDFAGTGLEDDGANNLRIAAAAAGAGLTGGSGSALAVGAGTHITVNADDVAVNVTTLLAAIDSTSVVVSGGTLQSAAVTGAISKAQNATASLFAGIRDNGSLETARTFLNFVAGTNTTVALTQDAGNDEIEVAVSVTGITSSGALSGAVTALAGGGNTRFAGILDNGAAENDRTLLNFLTSTSIVAVVTDDAINDELELTWQRAALTGAITASQNSNATLFDAGASGAGLTGGGTAILAVGAGTGITVNANDVAWTGLPMLDEGVSAGTATSLDFTSTTSITAGVSGAPLAVVQLQRAALTGEVTAGANSNATTVTRSTDFTWTGDHYFEGEVALVTEQTHDIDVSGSNVTLNAGVTRLTVNGTNPTLTSISGGTDVGRILEVYYNSNGSAGNLLVQHATAGGSGNESRLFHPDNADQTFGLRGSFIAQAVGSAGWRTIALTGNTQRLIQVSYANAADASISVTPPAAATWFEVEACGGGGGGGGTDAEAIKESCAGAGGGAGAWFRHRLAIASGNITGSIGGGGTAGSTSGGNGGAGGLTRLTYNSVNYDADGGSGGSGTSAGPNANAQLSVTTPGQGGFGTSNVLERSAGGDGYPGIMFSVSANPNCAMGGNGGSSFFGGGALGGRTNADAGSSTGQAALAIGAGGGGGARTAIGGGGASTGAAGGAGNAGMMRISFYSGTVPTFNAIS